MPDPIRVFSAGSLRHALPAIVTAFQHAGGAPVALTLGPAGLLRQRIEAGEPFDLFISADMGHPQRLAAMGVAEAPVCLARNRLCALARSDLGLCSETLLNTLSDPAVRIGTSTPGDDPCGDYAVQMFDLIEAKHPGRGADLKARARHLLGGKHSPRDKDGAALIAEGVVDVYIGYCTSARSRESDPAFSVVEIPPPWAPRVEYGVTMRKGANEGAMNFRTYLMSVPASALLQDAGFGVPGKQ